MPRIARRSLAAAFLVLGAAAAPASAAALPPAVGAVAYFQPAPKDSAATVVVFRTDGALPSKVAGFPTTSGWVGGRSASMLDVSPSTHCYTAQVDGGKAGTRVRVRVGRGGAVLDRTLRVRRMTPAIARGASLGCGADPVIFGLYPSPLVQPGRWFFTANAGPYLKDLVWSDWGAPSATATGTYVSDCASCGPPQRYPVTVTVDRLGDCPAVGAKTYGRLAFERVGGRLPSDPTAAERTLPLAADLYC